MKYLIILRGASGVGKTSVAQKLAQKLGKRTAHVPVDITPLNLMIDCMKIPKETRVKLMYDNAEDLVRNFLSSNFTVVTDAMFTLKDKNKSRLQRMIQIGENQNARIFVFELCADLDVLKTRAKQRASHEDVKTGYKSIHIRHKKFLRTRYKNAVIIDTKGKTINQIVNEILKQL